MTTLLLILPVRWAPIWQAPLREAAPAHGLSNLNLIVHGKDAYAPGDIDYALGFRPDAGLLGSLPKLKAIFSLGAGVDGFLSDPAFPKHVPLVRFVNPALSLEMAQYCVLHTLIHHRRFRTTLAAQAEHKWTQAMPEKGTAKTGVGILGFGEIGIMAGERLRDLGFAVAGWSRTKKDVPGIESFAGEAALGPFLARSDILICLLPLTPETRGVLNRRLFAQLPKGAYLINAARGAHQVEADVIAALNEGQLSGASLDVFETEPLPKDNPLWAHPKIIVTPHNAGLSDPIAAAQSVAAGIAAAERGQPLQNVVDMARGY